MEQRILSDAILSRFGQQKRYIRTEIHNISQYFSYTITTKIFVNHKITQLLESKNQLKEYTNGEITVVWDASKCIHAGLCAGNLPSVFRPDKKPWIDIHGAESAKIADQVSQCPSGALSYRYNQ